MVPSENTTKSLNFLENVGIKSVIEMFGIVPDTLFWVKQTNGQIVYCNKVFIEHIGLPSLEETIGLSDYDFAPRHLAKQYIYDDQEVLNGRDVTDRLELIRSATDGLCWFSTTKRRLKDQEGHVVGTYGISRHLEKTSVTLQAVQALKMPVDYIRNHYMDDINVAVLAEQTHLSLSALERRFKKYLNMTPKQYIHEVRLEQARKLLVETNMPIALVAHAAGFTDHSYFTRLFKRRFGELPSSFRDAHP